MNSVVYWKIVVENYIIHLKQKYCSDFFLLYHACVLSDLSSSISNMKVYILRNYWEKLSIYTVWKPNLPKPVISWLHVLKQRLDSRIHLDWVIPICATPLSHHHEWTVVITTGDVCIYCMCRPVLDEFFIICRYCKILTCRITVWKKLPPLYYSRMFWKVVFPNRL